MVDLFACCVVEFGYIVFMILFFVSLIWILNEGISSSLGPALFVVNFVMELFVMRARP